MADHPSPHVFVLVLFDRQQWCTVLEARFEVADLGQLRELLELEDGDDANIDHEYQLDDSEAVEIIKAHALGLNLADVADYPYREFSIHRLAPSRIREAPYLIHTNFELPLLLDGRKKLARMSGVYPPMDFEGLERFDHWVDAGRLHKEVILEPFAKGVKHPRGRLGLRCVYYTLIGEEWRIPAMQLVQSALWKCGGWNTTLERLEGMLFGYEDWQNDWWIERYTKPPRIKIEGEEDWEIA